MTDSPSHHDMANHLTIIERACLSIAHDVQALLKLFQNDVELERRIAQLEVENRALTEQLDAAREVGRRHEQLAAEAMGEPDAGAPDNDRAWHGRD